MEVGLFWGFFSGVMRLEIVYVLERKLGLSFLVVVGMEDVLGKFDLIGLLVVVEELEKWYGLFENLFVIYVGDIVGDLYMV